MVDRNLIRSLQDDSLEDQYDDILGDLDFDQVILDDDAPDVDLQKIIIGRVINIRDGAVLVDVGFKSEGTIPLNEWENEEEQPKIGDELKVLVEDLEDESGKTEDPFGMISLSWGRAKQILEWEELMKSVQEGMVVTGTAIRKIKGGLLVNIGVQVFLPASQVDIRRPHDIGDYIGRFVQCEVLKIDEARRNIVVSRRSLIEKQREEDRVRLLRELEEGQIRKGVVKNIADFGAFVDLGGIDGLLHITDMDYKRIGHPSEKVSIDQEIDVMILNIDREKQKIALGLKQMQANPWDNIAEKYPVGEKFPGEVVNVMTYGAFVMLEPGIEGLVHISEMSWTERINHPNEMVQIGDKIDVVILSIDKQRNQLSLGIKQTQSNPWDEVMKKYPVDSTITGKVRNLTSYGAFIELEKGIDGLLHVSDMSWVKKVNHPSEVLEKGQEVECKILAVDQERRRIALGLKQLDQDPWASDIPSKYQPGQVVNGKVTKITNFGVFVGLEDGLEGLLHISELADHKVDNPEELVNVGDELEVKILRVDTEERKIGLSRKRVEWNEEDGVADGSGEYGSAEGATGDLKGGLGESGPLFKSPDAAEATTEEPAAEAATEETASEEPVTEGVSEEPVAEETPAVEEGEAAAEPEADDSSEEEKTDA